MHFILIWFVHYLICSCSRDSWIFWEVLLNKNMLNRFFSQINAPVFVDRHFPTAGWNVWKPVTAEVNQFIRGHFRKPTQTMNDFFWEEITRNDHQLHRLYSFIHSIPFHFSSFHFIWSLQHWVGITTVSSAAPCNSWTRSAWSLRSFCSSSRIPTWAKVGNSRSRMWQGKVIISVNVRTWIHVFIIRE